MLWCYYANIIVENTTVQLLSLLNVMCIALISTVDSTFQLFRFFSDSRRDTRVFCVNQTEKLYARIRVQKLTRLVPPDIVEDTEAFRFLDQGRVQAVCHIKLYKLK